jgi:hypothetical protein
MSGLRTILWFSKCVRYLQIHRYVAGLTKKEKKWMILHIPDKGLFWRIGQAIITLLKTAGHTSLSWTRRIQSTFPDRVCL